MTRRAARSGLTLLEVTLAISLAVSVMGGSMAFHSFAADARRRLQHEAELATARRVVMGRITDELRGAIACSFTGEALTGADGRMRFYTAALPGPAAWAVRKSTEDPIEPEQDVRYVGYRLRVEENEDGEGEVLGIERTEQKIILAEVAEEGKEVRATFMTPHVKFLHLRYHDGDDWAEKWTEADLPLAVEITLGEKPLPEGTEPAEYPYDTHRRVVHLPLSTISLSGTIIRDGPGGSSGPGGER